MTRSLEDRAPDQRAAMARRLKQVRSILSSNQAAVARALGLGTNTWNRYEQGQRDIDLDALAEFCRGYGTTPADQIGLLAWVVLGRRDMLNREVLEELVLKHPEIVRPRQPAGL